MVANTYRADDDFLGLSFTFFLNWLDGLIEFTISGVDWLFCLLVGFKKYDTFYFTWLTRPALT